MPEQNAPVKETFLMPLSWHHAIDLLSNEDAGRLAKAIFMYNSDGTVPVTLLRGQLQAMFLLMKPVFDGELICADGFAEEDA